MFQTAEWKFKGLQFECNLLTRGSQFLKVCVVRATVESATHDGISEP